MSWEVRDEYHNSLGFARRAPYDRERLLVLKRHIDEVAESVIPLILGSGESFHGVGPNVDLSSVVEFDHPMLGNFNIRMA